MFIKDMFAKPINRELQGVIVVGQDNNANVRQELEEYVVTNELQKHFRDFFANYKKSIHGTTPKMGVWISGFFGSGKSHFLKILAYLLENREVDGKRALDYFIDDHKISDPAVLADMKLATQIPTDVISFNIAAKSDNSGNKAKDAIVNVFLRVFNEMQGFCGAIPWVADLERKLSEGGRYDEFKRTYQDICGDAWEESRDDFDYVQDDVVDTLVQMDIMSEQAARNWCEKASGEFSISIEDFAQRVKAYLARKDKEHHIVFFIDEVGQYVGDDSRLMLDLQTVTEELGKQCNGKVWIVVTSQQDIDAITKVRGNDFSKIQGRFDTRLSLSSANVDTIIKKRILEKNDTAKTTLRLVYEQQDTAIKNLITFNDTVEKKLYADEDDFAAVYPFIPYQFDLLANVLNSIRTHGASGKHLSEGERSMLAMFKESAMAYADCEVGTIIPLYSFYDALENFLDHSHRSVISRAYENSRINPNGDDHAFAVDVLKTLFLIKYVQTVTANAENITTLMIQNLTDDRITLKEQVSKALQALISQNLVQKNVDTYVFLTNEEQEINREIRNENVELGEIIRKAAELIFDDIFVEKKYRYPKFNGRYTFAFNQSIDEYSYKIQPGNELAIHILTPAADMEMEDSNLRSKSQQEQSVLVVLPPDQTFMDELRIHLQIEKFLQRNTSMSASQYSDIKRAKSREMSERLNNAKMFLAESLKGAAIYVNGNLADSGAKDIFSRLLDALDKLVKAVYSKLSYINTPMDDGEVRKALHVDSQAALELSDDTEANANALQEVLSFISGNTRRYLKTSMKTLKDYFFKKPYGYVDNDVEWIVARLFKRGDLAFSVNGETVTLAAYTEKDIFEYITKKQYAEKLLMERRERVSDREKRIVKDVMKELFYYPIGGNDDEDALMKAFLDCAGRLDETLKKTKRYYDDAPYPGYKIIENGLRLLQDLRQQRIAKDFFAAVKAHEDALLTLAEDLEPIQKFFDGQQKTIFDSALKVLSIFDGSREYIVDDELEGIVTAIRRIANMPCPYREIPKLPELVESFNQRYVNILDEKAIPVKAAIDDAKQRVFEELSSKPYKAEKIDAYEQQFSVLVDGAASCNNVTTLRSYMDRADALKVRLLDEMRRRDYELARQAEVKDSPAVPAVAPHGENTKQVQEPAARYVQPKRSKTISIKSVVLTNSWRIQSPSDVDACVSALKKELLKKLDDDTIINIEF